MKRAPVTPAQVVFDPDGTPRSTVYSDVYHARAGAIEQARAVFLQGNGLPERWRGRERFVILETGFGLGHNFLATWQAWAQDQDAASQLWFVSIERHPVPLECAARALAVHQGTPLQDKAEALLRAWPSASPDGFRASFDEGRVRLQVIHADVAVALREWRVQADAVFLDGFSPRLNPEMWSPHVFKALARRVATGCTAATWSTSRAAREGLTQAGFEVERVPGFADKRWRLQARLTRPAADAVPAPAPAQNRMNTAARPGTTWTRDDPAVVIIGAGLAGAACAQALSAAGVPSLVLERAEQPAPGASGNPAGLYHGVLHPEDGTHARLGRAAAWMAHRQYGPLVAAGLVAGHAQGLLRREDQADAAQMHRLIDRLGLPPDYVQAVPAERVPDLLNTPRVDARAAWFYPGGGWIDPAAWVRHALQRPGVEFKGHSLVDRIHRVGREWQVIGPDGEVLAQTRHLVLCPAGELQRLLPDGLTTGWPVGEQRGQITRLAAEQLPARGPARPYSGSGYALTLPGGDVLCGATASFDDPEPELRPSDHLQNLERLNRLLGWTVQSPVSALAGRVGWRFHAADRLPIVGPVEALERKHLEREAAGSASLEAAPKPTNATRLRDVPMEPGLYAATALGSRGITWAPMVGAVIAHWISGEPPPLPTSLLEAVDPRRFALKRLRRTAASAEAG